MQSNVCVCNCACSPAPMNKPPLLGIDVGGTNLRLALFQDLTPTWEGRYAANLGQLCAQSNSTDEAEKHVLAALSRAIESALQQTPAIASIGIGFPGFIHPGSRMIRQSPNLPGLQNLDLISPLTQRFGCPVTLENDALAAAYGEHLLCQAPSLLYVGLGTGVGGGLIIHGQPYTGEHGVAMEIGHLIVQRGGRLCGCGNRGCLEQYASATGVQRNYTRSIGFSATSSRDIAERAKQGDSAAITAFQQAGQALGQALAHILKVVDVNTIVIGGGMVEAWDLFYPALTRRLEQDLIPVLRGTLNIRPSTSEDRAGMLGAAYLGVVHK